MSPIEAGWIISAGLGSVVGLILALTGAGGAIVAVPLLIFGLHLSVPEAAPIALLAVGFGLMLMHPPTVIFGVFLAYLASGYVVWLWRLFRKPQGVTEVAATGAEEKK